MAILYFMHNNYGRLKRAAISMKSQLHLGVDSNPLVEIRVCSDLRKDLWSLPIFMGEVESYAVCNKRCSWDRYWIRSLRKHTRDRTFHN
jgi:hypothetical protein